MLVDKIFCLLASVDGLEDDVLGCFCSFSSFTNVHITSMMLSQIFGTSVYKMHKNGHSTIFVFSQIWAIFWVLRCAWPKAQWLMCKFLLQLILHLAYFIGVKPKIVIN